MATRDIVPRADGEGQIGTTEKAWLSGHFKTLYTQKIENDSSGDTPDYVLSAYASWADAISNISTTVARLIVDTDATVSADSTVPTTLTVKVYPGCLITVNSAKTLTINGVFDAGMYQVFVATGTVVFGYRAVSEVYPEWFGAIADNSTDCYAAITSCYASISAGVIKLHRGTYKISAGIAHNKFDVTLSGSGRYTSFIKNYGNGVTLTITKGRFVVENLALLGNDTASNAIYIQAAGYGAVRDIFIEDHLASAIKMADVVQLQLSNNNIYGPGAGAASGVYGFEFAKETSNNTSIVSSNNYITGFYDDIFMDDYSVVAFNSVGDILETCTNCVEIQTNCRALNFIGTQAQSFTNKAFLVGSGNVSIINPEYMNYDDIDESGLTGADGSRDDSVYLIASYPAGGEAYDPATSGSMRKIGPIKCNAYGHVTNAKLPAFLVTPTSSQENIAADGYVTVVFGTEIFDQGGNFASNTFTAPVTGRYHFDVFIYLNDIDSASTRFDLELVTSNRTFTDTICPSTLLTADTLRYALQISVLTDMDVNDTAYARVYQTAGAAQTDILAASYFSGYLVC